MTGIILTVTPRRAWLSVDSAICATTAADTGMRGRCAATTDADALAAQFADPPVEPRRADWYALKIFGSPEKRFLLTISGLGGALAHAAEIGNLAAVDGLDALLARLPGDLARFSRARPREAAGILFLVGWSARAGRCMAYYLGSDDGWRAHEIIQAHVMSPQPHRGLDSFPEVYRLWSAPPGQDVETFHLAVAMNQYEAASRGLYSGRPAIGGPLFMGEVDRAEARLRPIGVLQ